MDYSIIKDKAEDFKVSLQRLLPTMINTSIPGIIDELTVGDDGVPRVSAYTAIRLKYINPETREVQYIDSPKITNIPLSVNQCEGLGLSITMPVLHGQLCTLIFSQRSLDNFATTGQISNPTSGEDAALCTVRCFDYTDAMCFPGVMTPANNISNYSQTAVEVRNRDGSVKLSVYPETLSLTQGTASIQMAGGNITINAGTVTINGDLSVSGTISSDTDVLSAGISGKNHVHTGNMGQPTSPPVPE